MNILFNRNQSEDEQDSNLLLVPGIMNAPRTPGVESGQVRKHFDSFPGLSGNTPTKNPQ